MPGKSKITKLSGPLMEFPKRNQSTMERIEAQNKTASLNITDIYATYIKYSNVNNDTMGYKNICFWKNIKDAKGNVISPKGECIYNKSLKQIALRYGAEYRIVLKRPVTGILDSNLKFEFPIQITDIQSGKVYKYSFKSHRMELYN